MNKTDLSEYFELLRKGDRQAFAEIFSEFKVPVYTIICRIVRSQQLAEDITLSVSPGIALSVCKRRST